MGRSLTLRVIAEGIETEAELAFLVVNECDEGQGYYFSRPVAPGAFAHLLRTGISKAGLPARVLPGGPALLVETSP
jgi:EAL domain-containing protein (putative c-di-GMP-specific phosphodiesterase class I)